MENATKALLIAAAVLIAILIISLGLVVYNMASETVENSGDLSEYEIQQHNEKFEKYCGTGKTGTNVNAMLKTIFNHNLAQDDTTGAFVSVTGVTTLATDATGPATKVSTGERYTVTATYNDDGMITSVDIQQ